MNKRNLTKKIKIGNIYIGSDAPILVQSMCNIKTSSYRQVINQINKCQAYGAHLMRFSILDEEDIKAIPLIKKYTSIPLIADIHFNYQFALKAIKNGIDAIRINPGNIGSNENIKKIVDLAKIYDVPIRIGVNSGSLDCSIAQNHKIVDGDELIASIKKHVEIFENFQFTNLVLSLKGSNVLQTIKAYQKASEMFTYPLHLGITESGVKDVGLIRSSAGLAPLLLQGIGNTIRISLSEDPVEELKACNRLLHDLGLKDDYPTFISCPTCGRTQVNLIPLAKKIQKYLEENHINKVIAIMGCVVNGPGEAKHADLGIAGGKNCWVLFKKGQIVRNIADKDVYEELIKEINKL